MASNPRVSYKTAQNSPVEPSCRCGQGQPALGPRLEFSNLSVDRFQKRVVLRQIEYVLLNPRLKLASHEIFANLLQLLLRNQFEPNLIKITEEPRVLERARCHGRILDGQSAPQQLVTARGVHRVDAEVRPADANAIFWSKGSGRVVLGHDPTGGEDQRVPHTGLRDIRLQDQESCI